MFVDPMRDHPGTGTSGAGAEGSAGDAAPGVGGDSEAVDGVGGGVGLSGLSRRELVDRVVGLVAERARVEGEYLAALGELTSRSGAQSAAWQLREYTRMNTAQARSESRLAANLAQHDLSDTLDALQAGQIQLSHARVIAREAPKKHRRSEEEFLELSRLYPSDLIARHPLAYQSQQVHADLAAEAAAGRPVDPVDAELALQRGERSGSMRLGDDGMWHLRAKLDFIAGRHLSHAIQAALRKARQRDSAPESTRAQLTADAIADLIAGNAAARRANTNLLIIADYDTVNNRLANPRLDDGTPLSARQLTDHAVDANVLPAMFNTDWSQLALGRTRNASDAQRLILAARDGGCIACNLTSEHTQAHHIEHYEHGGPTNIANLASLCEPCHHNLHQHNHQIEVPPNGRPHIRPATQHAGQHTTQHPDNTTPTTARSP